MTKAKPLSVDDATAAQLHAKASAETITKAKAPKLAPDVQEQLDRMRAERDKHTANKSDELHKILREGDPEPDIEDACFQFYSGRKIELFNGMILELGPPPIPHMLVVAKMFDFADASNSTHARANAAKIMQYVRSVNGRPQPKALVTWQEVEQLIYELGELGCKAVYEVYEQTWADRGGAYWTDVKKNVPKSGLSRGRGADEDSGELRGSGEDTA